MQITMPIADLMPDPTVDSESAVYAVAIGIVVLSVGLLLMAFVIWKSRNKKLNTIQCPTGNPKRESQ
jgi:hypothetical protein